jgi:hypothetical protein
VDISIKDLDFIGLEKLSKARAHYEIEAFLGIVRGPKGVTSDKVKSAETQRRYLVLSDL